jgi:hypothetical protein
LRIGRRLQLPAEDPQEVQCEVTPLTRQRKAFELCDGVRTSTEIATATKVPKTTLSGWTREWRNLGIANEIATAKGWRIQHLISLAALELPLEVKES